MLVAEAAARGGSGVPRAKRRSEPLAEAREARQARPPPRRARAGRRRRAGNHSSGAFDPARRACRGNARRHSPGHDGSSSLRPVRPSQRRRAEAPSRLASSGRRALACSVRYLAAHLCAMPARVERPAQCCIGAGCLADLFRLAPSETVGGRLALIIQPRRGRVSPAPGPSLPCSMRRAVNRSPRTVRHVAPRRVASTCGADPFRFANVRKSAWIELKSPSRSPR